MAEAAIEPIVAPHLEAFGTVLTRAFAAYQRVQRASPRQLAQASPASRGMLRSDLMLAPAHKVFDQVPDVRVEERFARPWILLDDGRVQVRFRGLTPALGICPSASDRAIRLAYHLGDQFALDVSEATVLTAGLVLDATETRIERSALVCLLGFHQVHYWFPLPGAAVAPAATQLPLAPLSAPIIRSARAAAAQRLADRHESS